MSKKVSIIIPTYNGKKFIKETIDSCLSQSYKDIEIIVIDDCSSDGTLDILSEYGDKINLILNKTNQGISKNVNKGVEKSAGTYFMLLGHDDVLAPHHLAIMVSEFNPNIVSVYCNSMMINEDSKELKMLLNDKVQEKKLKTSLLYLSVENFISSCGMLHKKSIFDKVGGWDTKYMHYGEWLYYVKSLKYGSIKYTLKTQSKYRRHSTNITNTFSNKNVKVGLYEYFTECRELAYNGKKFTLVETLFVKMRLLKQKIYMLIER